MSRRSQTRDAEVRGSASGLLALSHSTSEQQERTVRGWLLIRPGWQEQQHAAVLRDDLGQVERLAQAIAEQPQAHEDG